jgi:cold shock CspA family protein
MLVGKIASIVVDKGFGFIKPAKGGTDVFFHMSTLKGRIEDLKGGEEVNYEMDSSAEKPRAKLVEITGRPSSKSEFSSNRDGRNERGGGQRRSFDRDSRGGGDRRGAHGNDRRDRNDRGDRTRRTFDQPELEFGYVTKIKWRDKQGFISSDKHGPELVFDSVDVSGEKPFERLKVGDYVGFVRSKEVAVPPVALKVQYTERKIFHPRLHLSRHPNSRAKKPTWR